jgi:hypothetical protein
MTAEPVRTVADVLARDLRQRIEEIVKVDQTDEESVYREITEYVVTDRLREQYKALLRAIRDAQSEPHEGIGVWISGFFGSGKSSRLNWLHLGQTSVRVTAASSSRARSRTNGGDIIDSYATSRPRSSCSTCRRKTSNRKEIWRYVTGSLPNGLCEISTSPSQFTLRRALRIIRLCSEVRPDLEQVAMGPQYTSRHALLLSSTQTGSDTRLFSLLAAGQAA